MRWPRKFIGRLRKLTGRWTDTARALAAHMDPETGSFAQKHQSRARVEAHLKLLRKDYAAYNEGTARSHVTRPADYVDTNIVPDSRVTVVWGNGVSQVIGKGSCTYKHVAANKVRPVIGENPSFYIVTPARNAAEYIDSTISSVVTQEGPFTLHYHVQDGGSTDETIAKLEKWAALLSDPECPLIRCSTLIFTYASERDNGMYDAIDKAFRRIGPPPDALCTWINADDVLVGGALSTVAKVFRSNADVSWILGSVNGCGKNQEELSQIEIQYPRSIVAEGLCDHRNWRFIQQEGAFWTGQLWSDVGGVNAGLKLCGDWDLWRRFAIQAPPVQIMWPLGRFRIHGEQLSATSIEDYYEEMHAIVPAEHKRQRLIEILATGIEPTRLVMRPNSPVADMKYELVPLRKKFSPSTRNNSDLLQEHFRSAGEAGIKVLTLCTIAYGGAGTGSVRRVEALRSAGIDARLVSLISESKQRHIGRIIPALDGVDTRDKGVAWKCITSNNRRKITDQRFYSGHDFFSVTDSLLTFNQLKPLIDDADIIHLHWVVGMIDYHGMYEGLKGKPVVWTTADMNPFTGGCHYSEGCDGFMRDCSNCPMVDSSSNVPHETWKIKKAAYKNLDFTLICPSEYIADLARQSSLVAEKSIVVIPNAYPIERLQPAGRAAARARFSLPANKRLVLFGADSLTNPRKGGDLLLRLARELSTRPKCEDIEFMCIGTGNVDLPGKVHHLGELSQTEICQAYSAADVYVSLSREDVGPMTVVESLLCGTPVVGFSVGLLPEVIIPRITGIAVAPYSVSGIADGILHFLSPALDCASIAKACRQSAVAYGDPTLSAKRHRELYEHLIDKRKKTSRSA